MKKRAFIDYKFSEVMNDYHLNKNFCPSLFQKFCQVSEASLNYISGTGTNEEFEGKKNFKKIYFWHKFNEKEILSLFLI